MDKVKRAWIVAPFGACLLLLGLQPARAEVQDCTNITAIPATISTQGVYCLKQHESAALASGAAITINVNNVTLDCNEFKIGNLAAGSGTNATGVQASGRINVTVRNCGIRGFRTGVRLRGDGHWPVPGREQPLRPADPVRNHRQRRWLGVAWERGRRHRRKHGSRNR